MSGFDFSGRLKAFVPENRQMAAMALATGMAFSVGADGERSASALELVGDASQTAPIASEIKEQFPDLSVSESCFADKAPLEGHGHIEKIQESSLYIAYITEEGKVKSGTGTVVQNSAEGDGANRILTAAHVAHLQELNDPSRPLMVYGSDGSLYGTASMVEGPSYKEYTDHIIGTDYPLYPGSGIDTAALEIDAFASPEAEAKYRSLAGLPLASEQSENVYNGASVRQAGVVGGASGTAAVNANGEIIGVITMAGSSDGERSFQTVDMEQTTLTSSWTEDTLALPDMSFISVTPVSQKEVLSALGAEETQVVPRPPMEFEGATGIMAAGYPRGMCHVYDLDVVTLDIKAQRRIREEQPVQKLTSVALTGQAIGHDENARALRTAARLAELKGTPAKPLEIGKPSRSGAQGIEIE